MRYCLRDPRRTMGNNETIIKEYQNQSAVSNQAGRDPLLSCGDVAADEVGERGGAGQGIRDAGEGKNYKEELLSTFHPCGDMG